MWHGTQSLGLLSALHFILWHINLSKCNLYLSGKHSVTAWKLLIHKYPTQFLVWYSFIQPSKLNHKPLPKHPVCDFLIKLKQARWNLLNVYTKHSVHCSDEDALDLLTPPLGTTLVPCSHQQWQGPSWGCSAQPQPVCATT